MTKSPVTRAIALIVVLILAVGSSGCESAVARQRTAATQAPRTDGSVPQGGTLRVGVDQDFSPKTFLQIGQKLNGTVLANVYDTLIRYTRDGVTPTPSLATAWRLAPDGLSLELDLRSDVTFHDGRPFVSRDVEESIKAYIGGPWTAQFKRTAAAITRFDTQDPHRVILYFAHPLSNVFDLLDSAPILDVATLPQLKEGTVYNGTGPFRFGQWQPKQSLRLDRNDRYWGGRPALEHISYQVIPDSRALYTRLLTGQIDIADELTPQDQQLAAGRNGFQNVSLVGAESQQYVGVNVKNPALSDVRLRQAIAYSIDRERIVNDVTRGSAYAVNVAWPRWSPAYDEADNRTYRRDVNKARELVREIGEIPEIPLDYASGGNQRIIAEIVQSNLADAGIKVRLVANDYAQQSEKLVGGKFEGLWILEHGFAQFTPSTLAVSAYPFNAAKNSSNYSDPDYTAAAEAAWRVADGTSPQALAAYRRLSEILLRDLFIVEIGVRITQVAASPQVGGVDWGKRNDLRFARTYLASPQ
ncbi:ABC transporter substrate-binding protein [Tsukamurella asaccharolytica]|uniref:ABC transporter substrate-binding protein n=1 Tax=Tsukamurella asaccharolytica TaxID=2592067 RepID=A0A5C5R597_9ACTN|nr:ABC transporter substrate-binding protein [Tsukamurella asaccharolytica]TWS18357.1 ABC transporter substrate-binding protein [Tsukamurella asaccharolytica]